MLLMPPVKTKERLSSAEIGRMATMLLEMGLPPKQVRLRLAEYGVKWEYQYTGQGGRERLRRLRQQGQGLCPECKSRSYDLNSVVPMCKECLEAKWTRTSQTGPAAPE